MTRSSVEKPRHAAATVTITEFCRLLGISRATYYRQAEEGLLPATRSGILLSEARAVLDARAAEAVAAAATLRPSTPGESSAEGGRHVDETAPK